MKRVLGFLFAAALLSASFITAMSASAIHADDALIRDFSEVQPGTALGDKTLLNSSGSNVLAGSSFIEDIRGGDGSTLKLASETAVWETAVIDLADYRWDFSDYAGIQFYMRRTGEGALHITIELGGDWLTFDAATISYRAKNATEWTKLACNPDNGHFFLPADFEGYVEIPFSGLKDTGSQLNKANLYDIRFLQDFSATQTLCLDDLIAVKELERSLSAPSSGGESTDESSVPSSSGGSSDEPSAPPTDSESSDPASAPDSTASTAVPQKSAPLASYADKSTSDNAMEALQDDSQGKASYIPSIRGKTGSSLKLIGTKGNMDWVAFGLKLVSGWDAMGMNAVELYIRKTPADKQSDNGAYRFAITEGGGTAQWETFRLKEKAKVLYMEKGGSTLKETEVLEDGVCMLPSGFEGIVRLPLDQFVYWYGGTAGNDKQIQKDNLYSLTITTDVNADTQYLVVDEISAIENIRYIGSQSPDTGAAACAGAAVAALAGAAAVLFWTGRKRK